LIHFYKRTDKVKIVKTVEDLVKSPR
jgi:hypothetical protein